MDAVVIHHLTRSAAEPGRSERQRARLALSRLGAIHANGSGPHTAVQDISLRIHMGEVFGILGPQASGKTTLLHLISGDLQPDSGSVAVFGYDTAHKTGLIASLVSPVRLDHLLLNRKSPVENLVYYNRLAGAYSHNTCLNSRALLSSLAMDLSAMDTPLVNLPHSEHKKVSLALALQSPARLLLLDDPFAGLEACDRQCAWKVLRKCHQQSRRTIIVATRDPEDVIAVSERAALLEAGKLVGLGAPAGLLPEAARMNQEYFALA